MPVLCSKIAASRLAAAALPSLLLADLGGCFRALSAVWALKEKRLQEGNVVGG